MRLSDSGQGLIAAKAAPFTAGSFGYSLIARWGELLQKLRRTGCRSGFNRDSSLITGPCSVSMPLPRRRRGHLASPAVREAAILKRTLPSFQGTLKISTEREENETL